MELFQTCQACLDAWIPRCLFVGPTYKGDEKDLEFFLYAFKLCWQPERKYDTILSYQDSMLRIEFNAKEGILGIWMKHLPVFKASLKGEVFICNHDPFWKKLLREQAVNTNRLVPDEPLSNGAAGDIFPL